MPAFALAQAPGAGRSDLIGSGFANPPGWWGAPGRPGWLPDAELGTGYPWTLAGLAVGAWALDEPGRSRGGFPPPGVVGTQDALAFFDTLTIAAGEGGGWDGFDAALARARAGPGLLERRGDAWRPRGDLALTTGSGGLSDHALSLWGGDSLGSLRADVVSGERGSAGGLAGAGRDHYDVAGALVRGRHMVEGAFVHRRADASLAGGEAQEVRGEGGHGRYQYRDPRWRLDASFARGYDQHRIVEDGFSTGFRHADANAAAIELERAGDRGRLGVRWSWSETHVAPAQGDGSRERARAHWAAVRWENPFGDGRLEASLGLGHHDRIGRVQVAPSVAWRFAGSPWTGRVVLERLLTPVWTDLAAGQSAFTQDSWVTGLQVGTRATGRGRAGVHFLVGRTHDRALLARLPLESLALRSGFRADLLDYDFALLMSEAVWRSPHWSFGFEGFVLGRDASPLQPWVDPGRGARVVAEARATFFKGDLRVHPRIEAAGIGSRESEAVPERTLPGYVTFATGLELGLADATLLIEGRKLENRARPQTWIDSATGTEALGPGRELRFTFSWRFWD